VLEDQMSEISNSGWMKESRLCTNESVLIFSMSNLVMTVSRCLKKFRSGSPAVWTRQTWGSNIETGTAGPVNENDSPMYLRIVCYHHSEGHQDIFRRPIRCER
jgi:hypothetical protein